MLNEEPSAKRNDCLCSTFTDQNGETFRSISPSCPLHYSAANYAPTVKPPDPPSEAEIHEWRSPHEKKRHCSPKMVIAH